MGMTETLDFLTQLRQNNNREWFNDHKVWYNRLRDEFVVKVDELIGLLARVDSELVGVSAKDCIFRIYRDIRFSADKTPYKPYFSMFAAKGGRQSPKGGYYLHLEPGNCLFSGGIWCPEAPLLKALRQAVYDNYDEFLSIVDDPAFKVVYRAFEGDVLKTVPRPYARDCEQAEFLKRKDYVVTTHVPDAFYASGDWLTHAAEKLGAIYPLNRFLNYTVDELAEPGR